MGKEEWTMGFKHNIPMISVLAIACALCVLCPAAAGAGDSALQLRVFALSMDPTGDTVYVPDTGERTRFDGDAGYGGGIELEYRVSDRLGIDFGVLTADPVIDALIDGTGGITARAQLRVTPAYAGINVHLTPNSRADLYVGPSLTYVVYSSFDLVTDPWFLREEFVTENDWGVGIAVGLDVRLGDRGWLLNAAFRYLDTTLQASPPDGSIGTTDLDPMIFAVGFGYRF
jgi:outer membrane protein W